MEQFNGRHNSYAILRRGKLVMRSSPITQSAAEIQSYLWDHMQVMVCRSRLNTNKIVRGTPRLNGVTECRNMSGDPGMQLGESEKASCGTGIYPSC